jgi:hypothetical protein
LPVDIRSTYPSTTGGRRPTFAVGGLRNRITSIEVFEEANPPQPMLVFGVAEELIYPFLRKVLFDLFSTRSFH